MAQKQHGFPTDSAHILGIKAFDEYLQERFLPRSKHRKTNLRRNNFTVNQHELKSKIFSITQNNYQDSIQMNGTLDGLNTYTRLSKFDRLENEYWQFIPMESLSITNKGNNYIYAPRIIINNEKNWYNTDNFLSEAIGEKGTFLSKDTILHLWNYLKTNREHYSPSGTDGMNSYNMYAVYGYSTCDIVAYVCRLLAAHNGNNAYSYLMPHHTVAEVSDGTNLSVVDADLEVFYLGLDNNTLVGINEVNTDKHLIRRTKHFGKNLNYDQEVYSWIAQIYSNGKFAPEKTNPNSYSYPKSSLDFILKPCESIHFEYGKAYNYYHNWLGNTSIPNSFLDYLVSNSKYTLATKFDSITFDKIFEKHNNICLSTNDDSVPMLYAVSDSAYFIYRVKSPFPLLQAHLKGVFRNQTANDSICIFLSLDDETTWEKLWTSQNTGIYEDSICIGQYFPLPNQTASPQYSYSIMVTLNPTGLLSACGLDSIYVENIFQISKRFLPTLHLGSNAISYQDANIDDTTKNIQVIVNWRESNENKPPNKIITPTFPLHQTDVDSLYFALTWQPATDNDGDEIVDYEFMLSDDTRMLYPLSPNFNLYVSAFGEEVIRPYFKVKETGWLNDGETYYWRIRAKDARGAWSEWSDTWSFTPHGVMRPTNGKAEIVGQSIKLSWERNPIGKQPDFYKIYASDEMNGFSPDVSTFFAEADSTEFTIPFDKKIAPYSFYRIAACDTLGQESLISEVISIPYPYMYAAYDSIRVDSTFSMNLLSNNQFYPYYYYGDQRDLYIPTITIEQKPDWLSFNEPNVLYSSSDATLTKKILYMDSTQCSVLVSLKDEWGNSAQQRVFLHTTAINNKPMLVLSDSVSYEGSTFSAYVTSSDGDVAFGDTNHYTILQKPAWLDYSIEGDTIYFAGIPTGNMKKDSLLRIRAVDTKNDSTTVEYLIHITPSTTKNQGKVHCIVFNPDPSGNMYFAKIESEKDVAFKYNVYSLTGALVVSSSNQDLKEGIWYLPIDMNNCPDGIYIFVGIEDNKFRHSIKFLKY